MTQIIEEIKIRDNPLGEGFLADKVVGENNKELAAQYCSLFERAREIVGTGNVGLNALEALHRYNRFTAWIMYQYGKRECNTQEECNTFVKSKLYELITCTGDWLLFWKWLRVTTINETSGMYGPYAH
jgi:hypothetical protein